LLIKLASQSKQAFFSGDIIHHVIQAYHPTWNSFACLDQERHESRGVRCWNNAPDRARYWRRSISARRTAATSTRRAQGFTPRFV
jgi:hypothetical protein